MIFLWGLTFFNEFFMYLDPFFEYGSSFETVLWRIKKQFYISVFLMTIFCINYLRLIAGFGFCILIRILLDTDPLYRTDKFVYDVMFWVDRGRQSGISIAPEVGRRLFFTCCAFAIRVRRTLALSRYIFLPK